MLITGLIFIFVGMSILLVSFTFWGAFIFIWRRQNDPLPPPPAPLRLEVPSRIAMARTAALFGCLSCFIGIGFCILFLGSIGFLIFPILGLLCYLIGRAMCKTYAKVVVPDILTVDIEGIRLEGTSSIDIAWDQILDMEFLDLDFKGHAFPMLALALKNMPPDLPQDLRIENIKHLVEQPGKHNAALNLKAFAMNPSELFAAISSRRPNRQATRSAELVA